MTVIKEELESVFEQYIKSRINPSQIEVARGAVLEKANDPLIYSLTIARWLIKQPWFEIKPSEKKDDVETFLAGVLMSVDYLPNMEQLRQQKHKLLIIESFLATQVAAKGVVRGEARELEIPEANIELTQQAYPADDEQTFLQSLEEHTGFILHELTPRHLNWISKYIATNPQKARRMVILKYGATLSNDLTQFYERLDDQGVIVRNKYDNNYGELVRATLGMVF